MSNQKRINDLWMLYIVVLRASVCARVGGVGRVQEMNKDGR